MPLPVIADTFRVTLNWELASGQPGHNVLHFYNAGDETDVNSALEANVHRDMWAPVHADAKVKTIDILKLDGVSAGVRFTASTATTKWTGGTTTGDYALQIAPLVSFRTAQRGPRGRGRAYLPFPGENSIGQGFVSSSVRISWQVAWEAFIIDMATDVCQLLVASYAHEEAHVVTSVDCESKLATQRRRQDFIR